jgi:hypothetical protein
MTYEVQNYKLKIIVKDETNDDINYANELLEKLTFSKDTAFVLRPNFILTISS